MFKNFIQNMLKGSKQKQTPVQHSDELIQLKHRDLFPDLQKNMESISKIYKIPQNDDVKTRNIQIRGLEVNGILVFLEPIVNTNKIERNIIKPLLTNTEKNISIESIISSSTIKKVNNFKQALDEINVGKTLLFIENSETAFSMDTSDIKSRNIDKPENEIILKGPKEAFTENIKDNLSLIRKKFSTESLINETIMVTKKTEQQVHIVYLDDVANPKILENVKNRLGSLNIDYVQNLGMLEQYIEERGKSIFPTLLYTERPDRASSYIEEGYIVLLMNNSPACLVLPATFWSFFHTPDEHYLRYIFGNFTRILRGFAIFVAVFTSAIYIAITNYHAQMIPPDLLLAISSTRERVPFPALVETLIMELGFELIREAGLRVPSPIGPTIGIVGALILGQAAVEANIISPIVIIVVALGGLSSFAVTDISFNYALRIIRFLFILAAGFFGIFGMTILFTMGLTYMISLKSFGVPYFAPMTPKFNSSQDTVFRRMLKNERFRPGFLKPKDLEKKGGNSR